MTDNDQNVAVATIGGGGFLKRWLRIKPWAQPKDSLEELIEEREEAEIPLDDEERLLLVNILGLRDLTVHDVMVPRADISAIDQDIKLPDLIETIAREGHTRFPVFQEDLDNTVGFIHAKDILTWQGEEKAFRPATILRQLLFVSPSMKVLELLLEMRSRRSHLALVVDEFGGVDGLVTIEDLVEEIVGEIEDEHDQNDEPELTQRSDGSWLADARVPITALEKIFGPLIDETEHEDIDTLGGLIFTLAKRVPIRGELINHPTGLEVEVVEADPRRVRKLIIRKTIFTTPKLQDN